MSETEAIRDVHKQLGYVMEEAYKTHGFTIAMAAATMFTATTVHAAEHHFDDRYARHIVLGKFLEQFHEYLAFINKSCDGNEDFSTAGEA